MRRYVAAFAAPIILASACSRSAVQIDYIDFVQLGGIRYLVPSVSTPSGSILPESIVGAVYGTVKVKLAGSQDPSHKIQDGDAAFLATGTQVYRVNGYRPTFRLAARHDGRLLLYESDTNPKARVGADLLDLAGKVQYIGINDQSSGIVELAAIKDPAAVQNLVDLIEKAPVDQSKQPSGSTRYFIDFHMMDGTEVIRSYWPDSGELARGILVPDAVKMAVVAALQ